MWNPLKSSHNNADIFASYEWPETFTYSMRMKLYEDNGEQNFEYRCEGGVWQTKSMRTTGHKAIVTGDCYGKLHIYDIGNGVRSQDLDDGSKERLPARRVSILVLLVHNRLCITNMASSTTDDEPFSKQGRDSRCICITKYGLYSCRGRSKSSVHLESHPLGA
jgi:hypothetical protein